MYTHVLLYTSNIAFTSTCMPKIKTSKARYASKQRRTNQES